MAESNVHTKDGTAAGHIDKVAHRVLRISGRDHMFVRRVVVDRANSVDPIDSTGGGLQLEDTIPPKLLVSTIFRENGMGTVVYFWESTRLLSDEDLEKEYARRWLTAATPLELAAINTAEPHLAATHPNATHWFEGGIWRLAAYQTWIGESGVYSKRNPLVQWPIGYWFAGTGVAHPAASVPDSPVTIGPARAILQNRTVKCSACGVMNFPTEWYCESCGDDLIAL